MSLIPKQVKKFFGHSKLEQSEILGERESAEPVGGEFRITRFCASMGDQFPAITRWDCGEFLPFFSTDTLRKLVENDRTAIVTIGWVDHIPAAFTLHHLYPHVIYLERIVVDQDFRGMGLGRQMFRNVKAKADSRRPELVCCVDERDMASLNFHKAMRPWSVRLIRNSGYRDCLGDCVQFNWIGGIGG